jgi:hypothetical protein
VINQALSVTAPRLRDVKLFQQSCVARRDQSINHCHLVWTFERVTVVNTQQSHVAWVVSPPVQMGMRLADGSVWMTRCGVCSVVEGVCQDVSALYQ